MNIGIDLDGVIFDTERVFVEYSALFDKLFNGTGIKHPEELRANKRYDWTEDQINYFMEKSFVPVEKDAPFMPGAIESLKALHEAGHKLFIITARGRLYPKEIKVSKQRLKGIENLFTEMVFGVKNKVKACKERNIDVMIDDYYKIVQEIANNDMKAIYFKWREDLKDVKDPNIKTVYSWKGVEDEFILPKGNDLEN